LNIQPMCKRQAGVAGGSSTAGISLQVRDAGACSHFPPGAGRSRSGSR